MKKANYSKAPLNDQHTSTSTQGVPPLRDSVQQKPLEWSSSSGSSLGYPSLRRLLVVLIESMQIPFAVPQFKGALLGSMLAMLLWGANACGPSDSPNPPQRDDALNSAIDGWILPSVRAFATEAEVYTEAAQSFCDTPTAAGLTALQDHWRQLSIAWNYTVLFNMGPMDDDLIVPRIIRIESKRQRGTDYTGTVRSEIQRAINGDFALDEAYFSDLTFTKGGLLALEVLSFEGGGAEPSTNPDSVLAGFRDTPRRCRFLLGMANRLQLDAEAIKAGWEDDFGGRPFVETLRSGELADGTNSIAKLIIVTYEHLDYVRRRKIGAVADARLSGIFYENIAANIDSVNEVLHAKPYSFIDHLRAQDFDAEAETILTALNAAEAAVNARESPLLSRALAELEDRLKEDLPRGLDVDLGITFSDGD